MSFKDAEREFNDATEYNNKFEVWNLNKPVSAPTGEVKHEKWEEADILEPSEIELAGIELEKLKADYLAKCQELAECQKELQELKNERTL